MIDDTRAIWAPGPFRHPIPGWGPGEPEGTAYHYIGGTGRFVVYNHTGCLAWVRQTELAEEAGAVGTHDVYSALSYNLVGCPHGRLIEGRGVQVESGAQLHGNSRYVGVLLMMNVMDPMTDALKSAAIKGRTEVLTHYAWAQKYCGHRDVADNPTRTSCPGLAVEGWLATGGPILPPPPPIFPPTPPTTIYEVGFMPNVASVVVSLRLDAQGHGWKDVPHIAREKVVGITVDCPDPPAIHGYLPNPGVGLATVKGKPHQARVVVTGGWPNGLYTVHVNATT